MVHNQNENSDPHEHEDRCFDLIQMTTPQLSIVAVVGIHDI